MWSGCRSEPLDRIKLHPSIHRLIDLSAGMLIRLNLVSLTALLGFAGMDAGTVLSAGHLDSGSLEPFLENHCYECHDSDVDKGGLNLEGLSRDLDERETFDRWVLVYDRINKGEMPPEKRERPDVEESNNFLKSIRTSLIKKDKERIEEEGRASVRRLNRFEYENCLREGLEAPWLQVADMLPEDGIAHLFNKSGERLDVSHVQMAKYLETALTALQTATQSAAYPSKKHKYYAREEPSMKNYLRYRFGQRSATRSAIPLIDYTPQPDVIRGIEPITVGAAHPEIRERESMGFVSGTYSATTKYDFTRMEIPIDGKYKLRIKSYTFLAGPNGASGGDDHGLTGGSRAWWRPSRTFAFPGTRSEPITLYALADSGDSRWLTTYDAEPHPKIIEREVYLRKGEKLRPDAGRLVRTRPGWKGNPNATRAGIPGFALNWLEVEGPLQKTWPPPSYRALFDDLPFFENGDGKVKVITEDEVTDAERLLKRFIKRMFRNPALDDQRHQPFLKIYQQARMLGEDFTDSMITALSSTLCSTDFLYLECKPGPLSNSELAMRLSLFLWNGPPDQLLRSESRLQESAVLASHAERLLTDEKLDRFTTAFLDYWLDLRDLKSNAPDATLYPDYYLDDLLTESSLLETRHFFKALIDEDLPAASLVDSDFTFINERLAQHYGLKSDQTVHLSKVNLPDNSDRGGLLTQSSLLRLTANGTTTSPVVRGAWIGERILGIEIPPPPSNVEAIEPDIRGAETIREQLEKHRDISSCNACHQHFDPIGLALESYDIAGGKRERYRATGESGDPVSGFGKNGHVFQFKLAKPVECDGQMADGTSFQHIQDLKKILLEDQRQIARNLLSHLIVYSTGAPVIFADREEVEAILDVCEENHYGVRSLIHALIQSELFRNK